MRPLCRPRVIITEGGGAEGGPAKRLESSAIYGGSRYPRVPGVLSGALSVTSSRTEITYADDDWVNLRDGGNVLLSFQPASNYQAPHWPSAERGQQFHIDVTVDDVDQADQQVLALGARRTGLQPGIDEDANWRLCLDPVGHPFCLCWD